MDFATQDVTCGPEFETSGPGVIAFEVKLATSDLKLMTSQANAMSSKPDAVNSEPRSIGNKAAKCRVVSQNNSNDFGFECRRKISGKTSCNFLAA